MVGTGGHTHAGTQCTGVVAHLYTPDRFPVQAHASSVYLAAAAIELTLYISVTRQAIKYPPQGWPGWHWIFMTADFSNYQMNQLKDAIMRYVRMFFVSRDCNIYSV